MKPVSSVIPTRRPALDRARPDWTRPRLIARRTLPTLSVVTLSRSPLARLAWVFGFGR